MGRQNSNPQHQDPFVFNPRINYSWLAGRQSFKTGYEYQVINTEIDDFNPKYGDDSYGGQFSRPAPEAADPATYNLADFMFGARSTYALTNPFSPTCASGCTSPTCRTTSRPASG